MLQTIQPNLTQGQYRALQSEQIILPQPAQLYECIVETLVGKGLATYRDADTFRRSVPTGLFLLVPPRAPRLALDAAMGLIQVDGAVGRNCVRDPDFIDDVQVPKGPYLLLDVEDGERSCGRSPRDRCEDLQAQGRSPYTLWEGIVHAAVFPAVFASHDMVLCGTTLASGAVPTLHMERRRPTLSAFWYTGYGYSRCGTPSCAGRLSQS